MRRTGFTLIELLVVISIIALLIAILLPMLSQARGQARVVQSLSNARQQGMMLHMYAHDWDDHLPQWKDHGPSPYQYKGSGLAPYWDGQLMPYTATADVFQAPADVVERIHEAQEDRRSYAINQYIIYNSGYGRVTQVPNLSGVMITMEYFQPLNVLNAYYNAYVSRAIYRDNPERWLMKPFPGGSIVHLFLDGHAKTARYGELSERAWGD